jgi:hypothetical protein
MPQLSTLKKHSESKHGERFPGFKFLFLSENLENPGNLQQDDVQNSLGCKKFTTQKKGKLTRTSFSHIARMVPTLKS